MKYIRIDINARSLNIFFHKLIPVTIRWQVVFLAVIILLLYAKTLHNEFIGLDEQSLLVEKKSFNEKISNISSAFSQHVFQSENYVEAPATIKFYRPILTVSFIIDSQFSKEGFSFFYFSNILTHFIAVIGLLFVLLRLNVPSPLSFFLSLLFAVHPLLIQAIAWIPGRNDSLACGFVLWSFYFLLNYFQVQSLRNLFLHLLLFTGALFTKENTAMLVPLCAFSIFLLHGKKMEKKKKIILCIYYLILGMIWFYARENALGEIKTDLSFSALFDSLLKNFPLVLQYLQKTILPVNLAVMSTVQDTNYAWVFLAVILFGTGIYFTKKIPWRELIFGLTWFFLFLLPPLLFSYFEGMEHRAYLPSVGLLISIAFFEPVQNIQKKKNTMLGIFCAVIVLFAIITFFRLPAFSSEFNYWKNAYETSDYSSVVCRDYGVILTKNNDYKTAEKVYLEGIKRNPKETLLHYNLGVMYYRMGNYEEAKRQVAEEMKINDGNFMMYHLMGGIYKMQKREEDAAMMWEHAVALNPKFADSYKELLKYYSEKKDTLNFLRCKKELEKQGFKFVKGDK